MIATLVSNAGDFPSVVGTDLLPHPLAVQYIKSGLPWIYEELPLWFAGLIDHYFIIGITIFICAEIYKKFADLSEMAHLLVEHVCLHVLAHIERYAKRGIPITGLGWRRCDWWSTFCSTPVVTDAARR